MIQILKTASILFGLLTVLTGVVYPLGVTLVAQVVFPRAANGSLIEKPGKPAAATNRGVSQPATAPGTWAGSDLIGQPFTDPAYFWGRPSATAPFAFNSMGGSGSNQAPTNPALTDTVRDRVKALRDADPGNEVPVPIDLVTASASGLDPHVSEAGALYQASRVARQRKADAATINKLVLAHIERPTFGILGQARVNVLRLNLALDAALAKTNP